MPTWMTTLWNAGIGFNLRPLTQITIPGTHDAGCTTNNWGAYFARTQTQTIQQQLAGGIRYFDIRPYRSVSAGNSTFWTYHGNYWGEQIDGVGNGILFDLANFMNGLLPGDRELVILNISHFSNFNDDAHRLLICKIYRALQNHLVPHTQAGINLFNATYTNLLTDGAGTTRSRVAIIYDGALDQGREHYLTVPANLADLPPGFFVLSPKYNAPANQIFLFDRYAGKCWLADGVLTTGMRTDQLDKLRNRQNYAQQYSAPAANWAANAVGGVASTLHLFSWTLTPQYCGNSPLTEAQNQSNPALLPLFSNATAGWAGGGGNYDPAADFKINILYVDDYDSLQYNNPLGSPCNGWAMPVAIAYRLNDGAGPGSPPWPANW